MAPLHRAAGALLHPVTLAAIVALLLNDYVFKHAWPNTWWTGKLSDVAWMAFAPPALAFIIALAVPRTPRWNDRVFAIAYVGLGLLYLAYNLNEPLHDTIMAAFAFLTGAEHTSPFDPTDAIVIPPGLALATLVWRRSPKPPPVRRFPPLAVATVAAMASVATSGAPPASYGIVDLDAEGDELVASSCFMYWPGSRYAEREVYRSSDGGLTWSLSLAQQPSGDGCRLEEKVRSVNTPRGLVQLRPGEGVFLMEGGVASLEVDTSFMDDPTTEALTYEQLSDRGVFVSDVSLGLFDLILAPSGENVVVAAGHHGVLVGLPDGSWQWARVGPYSPASQSPSARLDLLAKARNASIPIMGGFLVAATALLLNAARRARRSCQPIAHCGLIAGAVVLVPMFWMWGVGLWRLGRPDSGDPIWPLFAAVVNGMFIVALLVTSCLWARSTSVRMVRTCVLAGLLTSIAVVVPFLLWAYVPFLSLTLAKAAAAAVLVAIVVATVFILRSTEPREISG